MKSILLKMFFGICGFLLGVIFIIYRCGYILEGKKKRADRFYAYFNLLDRWLSCKEQGYELVGFLKENNIKSVAIYRMGKIGNHLKYELDESGIEIKYVIDEEEDVIYGKEVHYNLQDNLPSVDAVIVTSVDEFEEVRDKILAINKILNVISLEQIIDYMENNNSF